MYCIYECDDYWKVWKCLRANLIYVKSITWMWHAFKLACVLGCSFHRVFHYRASRRISLMALCMTGGLLLLTASIMDTYGITLSSPNPRIHSRHYLNIFCRVFTFSVISYFCFFTADAICAFIIITCMILFIIVMILLLNVTIITFCHWMVTVLASLRPPLNHRTFQNVSIEILHSGTLSMEED